MRKYLLAAVAVLALSGSAYAQDAFERGFEHGYKAVHPGYLTPLSPLPTVPKLGQSEFDAGIEAGVKRGREDNGEGTSDDDE
jgi:hypothetical protein